MFDGETAYTGLAARQSINVGQVCCVSSSDLEKQSEQM